MLVPPLPLQEQFACIAHKFERLHAQQHETERQAEHLFQTLPHRAFRGGGLNHKNHERTRKGSLCSGTEALLTSRLRSMG
jgi:hypothetical protein